MKPFQSLLQALRKPPAAPHKPSAVQMYLAENTERVREIYNERALTAEKTGIRLRNIIAEELLKAEPAEVQEEWERRVEEEYTANLKAYAIAQQGSPSADPEAQEE